MNNPFDRGYYTEHELKDFGFASIGRNVRIAKNATIVGLENISIGDNVRIDDFTVIIAAKGFLQLHNNIHICSNCQISCGGGIVMKDWSGCSSGVRLYSESEDYTGKWLVAITTIPAPINAADYGTMTSGPIILEKYVIIGANSVVLPKITLGEGCAIGALSLVTKSLPPWGVYFGSPVKKIKNRSQKMIKLEQQYLKAWNEQ